MRLSRKGERLNVLLVGASGTGKTSLISTIAAQPAHSEGEFAEHEVLVQGQPVSIVDTRGYGVRRDTLEKLENIEEYIRERNREHLNEETQPERDKHFEDRRVHLIVHFLSVSNRGMKEPDLALLKLLHTKANIILVIPKCDYHTEEELTELRDKIKAVIEENQIELFETPEIAPEKSPLAIFGASEEQIKGKKYVGRTLPTGQVLVCTDTHSDILLLLKVLSDARSDLIATTDQHFYENYRRVMLSK